LRICEIDFPEELLISQKDGNLAVFAGAGVSMPPPSNYPNFRDLANRVAGGNLTIEHGEPVDSFLGRIADRGTNVHQMVGQILTNPDSKPNSMHLDLLRLFRSPDAVRLVTTNFDPHFSSAAPLVFPDSERVEINFAPALPMGDSFSGIVHVHGGVEKSFARLVLTDADFGRAYLTEGWARVFLQKLFERYTVLFVGYSHNDPVMNYLARGLPPAGRTPRRFAFTPPGQEDRWRFRGIIPINYPLEPDNNQHSALPRAITAWAKHVRLGALEQEQRIKSIVELPPPIDPEDGDYIVSALCEPNTTRFFTRHANTVAWLKWVEERGFLKRLFRPDATPTEVDLELGTWFTERFQCKHVGESLSVLRRNGEHLSPHLWTFIAHRLLRNEPDNPAPKALHRWLTVLLNSRPPGTRVDMLEHLSPKLVFPDDTIAALLLFEYLSRPMLRIENDFWREIQESDEDVKFEIVTQGGGFWLNDFWRRFFSPNIADLAEKLESIATQHLRQAHLLSRVDDLGESSLDLLSLSRNMIEQPDQGARQDGIDVLVDAALGVLKWYTQNRPSRSDALIEIWLAADSLLLKRLAIFGVSLSTHWTADRQLAWLLDKDLFYISGLKHEVFELLKGTYSQGSKELHERVLKRARQGRQPVPEGAETSAEYEVYNLIYWLHTIDPRCAITKSTLDELQAAHPNFGKRERPDLDVVSSGFGWFGHQSPKTVEDVLNETPKAQLEYLLSFAPETPFGPSREGLIATMTDAVARNYQWGRDLADELETAVSWDSDLWSAIVLGWTRADFNAEQWNDALTFLDNKEKLHHRFVGEISMLLDQGIKKPTQAIPDTCLRIGVDLSKRLWSVLQVERHEPKHEVRDRDWLAAAINHPAGYITLFWLNWLARERKRAGSDWKGIPQEMRQTLEAVLAEPVYAGELGRVLLASQLNFLSSVDEPWTKDHILPLFDWTIDAKRAVQAFHGFLTWGRQTENLLNDLIPLYEKTFPHISELGGVRERFLEYLAGLTLSSSINPVTHGWLNRFLAGSAPQDRVHWASQVLHILRGAAEAARSSAWATWIKPYWAQRLLGAPLPLAPLELGQMVEWTLYVGTGFPEAVESVWASPKFELKFSSLLHELAKSELPQQHPAAAAKLLLKILQNVTLPQYDLDKVEDTVRRIAPLHAPLNALKGICNELANLGYPRAGGLLAWLQAGNP
jgi:hypothetical protein